jgi:hypothetical protein
VQQRSKVATAVFCLAAAWTGAAVVDPLVERLSNGGAFGTGSFTDHSNLDVIPALSIGLAFALAVVFGVVRRTLGRRNYAPEWLRPFALASSDASVAGLLPAIAVLQLGVVWLMETLEQIVVAGHPLGGTVWLGGPPAISVAMHAAGAVVATVLLARTIRWTARTLVDVVAYVCAALQVRAPRPALVTVRADLAPARFRAPYLAARAGRAPPYRVT